MGKGLFRALLKKYIRLVIAMVLVSSLGCGIMSGISGGVLSLKESLNDYVRDAKYPDVIITTEVTERDIVEKLRAIEGVEAVDARLMGNLALINKEGRILSTQAMSYDENEFQEFYFWEKGEKKGDYPILLEHKFAMDNGFGIGEEIEIRMDDETRTGTVYGVVSRPEMIAEPSLAGRSLTAGDVGYLYVPNMVLEREENPEHTKGLAEWEESSEEYEQAKADAEEEHDKAVKEIADAEEELKEKGEELEKGIREAEAKKAELKQGTEEIDKKLKEIEDLENDLKNKKASVEDGYTKVANARATLQQQKEELAAKRRELDAKKKELEDKKAELLANLDEVNQGLEELKDRREDLETWKELIRLLKENEDALEELVKEVLDTDDIYMWGKMAVLLMDIYLSNTDYIVEKLEEAEEKLVMYDVIITELENAGLDATEYIAARQEILDLLEIIGISRDQVSQFVEDLKAFVDEMQESRRLLILMLDVVGEPENIEILRVKIVDACNEFLDKYVKDRKITEEVLNAAMRYIENAEQKINDSENTLLDLKKQIEDGLAQIEDGLKQIADGYKELDGYDAKVRDGEAAINKTAQELDDYSRQIADGYKQTADGRKQAEDYRKEIASGIRRIDNEILDGKKQYAEGEQKVNDAREELETKWSEAEEELSKAKEDLDKAKEELDSWEGYDSYCNQFLIRIREGASDSDVLSKAEKVLGDVKIKDSYTYDTSIVKRKIDANVDPIEIIALFVPIVFFAVAMIVVSLFMSLLIRQCRREIGILRALGYSRNAIVLIFCVINAFASLCAVLLGFAIGFAVSRYIGTYFKGFFDLPDFCYVLPWRRIVISAALTFVVGQFATLLGTGFVSRISPTEAMSRPTPQGSVHSGNFMGNAEPFFKYSVLSLLRGKVRFFVSVICISFSVMLILMAISFYLSKNEILNEYFNKRINYDCEVFTKSEPSAAFVQRIADSGYARDPEVVGYYQRGIIANGVNKRATLKVISKDTDKIRILDPRGERIDLSEEGIILEKHLADELKVKAGDEVLIDGHYFRVSALSEQSEVRRQYLSFEAAEVLGKPDASAVILDIDTEDEVAFLEKLSRDDEYGYASFTDRAYKAWIKNFEAFTVAAVIVIVFSILIGFVVVFNTLRANLQQQKRELCVIRTLGFLHSQVSAKLFSQSGLYFVFAGILGVPLGIVLTKVILKSIEMDSRSYPYVNSPFIYIISMGIVFAYIIFSHVMSMQMMKKWDLVENVKDKE